MLEWEELVYLARVIQVRARGLHCVPRETGHCSVSKQLGCCSVRVKEEREGSVTVLHPCRWEGGGRSTALSITDAVNIQYGTCL